MEYEHHFDVRLLPALLYDNHVTPKMFKIPQSKILQRHFVLIIIDIFAKRQLNHSSTIFLLMRKHFNFIGLLLKNVSVRRTFFLIKYTELIMITLKPLLIL